MSSCWTSNIPTHLDHDRYFGKIQDKDDDYYLQFALVICGLDSVEARRWMNATLVNLVDEDSPDTIKPMIDGGTEGTLFYSDG
jgi:ubiquitin-activating enzyme E1 C